MTFWAQVLTTLKAVGGAGVLAVILYLVNQFNKVMDQKKRNEINEINLTGEKIHLDVKSKPIDQLVAESNDGHGADAVVKKSGSDSDDKG